MTREWKIKEEARKSLLSKPYPNIGLIEVFKKKNSVLYD
uniref:Macaca fascicularis brain cDNA clone: QccE-21009, similar to human hypothetical protein LOC157567 (LOC157567), mRNA, RefSeq: NM_198401.1 n=1 Tax=Macaca fascicularis TaxID=9541 RepID=I7G439_MACFA|nr:unnamed protein product [Macaca fascicularis]